ncbi:MAG: conjugal transfer protein TrbI [Proteobacteria bacterium]|nr:conjugal transfer protein TrbI [Pseudomonadota bacterium]
MSAPQSPVDREQQAIAKSLRLRGAPAPVARVSRKALIVAGAVLSAGLASAIGWSLTERPKAPPPEGAPQRPPPPEKISTLPKDYLQRGAPPKLGPPLPGDLGRPILSAQAEGAPVLGVASGGAPLSTGPKADPAPEPIDPVAEARRAEWAAARQSDVFLKRQSSASISPTAPAARAPERAAPLDARIISPERLQVPASPYLLQAGSIIAAALVTGLRSDAAGVAIAQVTQDVHDSLGAGFLLIPAGSRLIGDYATATRDGQSRLGVVWTRLILPSGRSIVLDKLPAADPQGQAGLQDGVDRHWSRVWAAAGLSTVLAVGAEAGASSEDDLTRAVRRGASQTASDVGQQIVGRGLSLTPTLTLRPGAPLRVLLTRDLVLEPYATERR